MEHHQFFQNRECAYFPCHRGADGDHFNCMFCYCPLYALGDQCGGNFSYLENGVKDCSGCMKPHGDNGYDEILARIGDVIKLAKKP